MKTARHECLSASTKELTRAEFFLVLNGMDDQYKPFISFYKPFISFLVMTPGAGKPLP